MGIIFKNSSSYSPYILYVILLFWISIYPFFQFFKMHQKWHKNELGYKNGHLEKKNHTKCSKFQIIFQNYKIKFFATCMLRKAITKKKQFHIFLQFLLLTLYRFLIRKNKYSQEFGYFFEFQNLHRLHGRITWKNKFRIFIYFDPTRPL